MAAEGQTAEIPDRRQPLSRRVIVLAAIAIVDAEGLPALTMRHLAGDLGVAATAIYWHLRTRDEVLRGMLEHVVDEIEPPGAGNDWADDARSVCRSMRAMLVRHPWVPQLQRQFPSVTTPRFATAMNWIGRNAGFGQAGAAEMTRLLGAYVVGSTFNQVGSGLHAQLSDGTVARWAEQGQHELLDLVPALLRLDDDAVFERGLSYLLDGIANGRAEQGSAGD